MNNVSNGVISVQSDPRYPQNGIWVVHNNASGVTPPVAAPSAGSFRRDFPIFSMRDFPGVSMRDFPHP
jgi:hypothetical protein